ncbi:response regulator [Spirulina sp. CS-785/01]|uniref:response regulator n=1 Tax=Spirulina sp. CS-785/01 TaxID=3021716 RepID=UPI0023303010|nr:response regulator [Spirulina sp. CS-785/01]MDB9315780.1 response regulator [Spirulina sp. CS-785/01]
MLSSTSSNTLTQTVVNLLLIESDQDEAELVADLFQAVERENPVKIKLTRCDRLQTSLEHLQQHSCDIILTNLTLPDSQGVNTVAQLRNYNVPVVVFTHLTDETVAQQTLRAGAQDYLVKSTVGSQQLIHSLQYAIERDKHQQKLSQQAYQYCTLLNQLDEVVFELDALGKFEFLNQAWTELTGSPIADTLHKPMLDSLHPADQPRYQQQFQQLMQKQCPYINLRLRCPTPNQDYQVCLLHASPVYHVNGSLMGIVGTIRSLTHDPSVLSQTGIAANLAEIPLTDF